VVNREQQRRRDLAEAVKSRRLQLGLSQGAIHERGGPSIVTVRQIEKVTGPTPSDLTLTGIDRALGWKHGSAQAILDGGTATVETDEAPPPVAHTDVPTAILNDPYLTPINRAHLINQYEILLTTGNQPPGMLEEQERRRQEALLEAEGKRILKAVKSSAVPGKPKRRKP
jgi:hypothetical protein